MNKTDVVKNKYKIDLDSITEEINVKELLGIEVMSNFFMKTLFTYKGPGYDNKILVKSFGSIALIVGRVL